MSLRKNFIFKSIPDYMLSLSLSCVSLLKSNININSELFHLYFLFFVSPFPPPKIL